MSREYSKNDRTEFALVARQNGYCHYGEVGVEILEDHRRLAELTNRIRKLCPERSELRQRLRGRIPLRIGRHIHRALGIENDNRALRQALFKRPVEGRGDYFVGLPQLVVQHRSLQCPRQRLAQFERVAHQVLL